MSWSWRLSDAAGDAVTPPGEPLPPFPSRGDAESWIGENWRALAAAGAVTAELFDGERRVGLPLPLRLEPS